MPKETYVHTRIDPQLKQQAELVFSKIGLSITDAVSLFFTQVALRDGLPFPLTIPADDMDYQDQKRELLEAQKAKLNAMIQEGLADVEAGSVLTPEQAKARTGQFLQNLREKKRAGEEFSR